MIRDLAQTGLKDRVITPGPSGIILPPGFIDARVTVSAVTFNAAKVLNDTTIAGTLGAMPDKTGSATVITPSSVDQAFPQGYYPGGTGDGKVLAVAVNATHLLAGDTVAGTAGIMPRNVGHIPASSTSKLGNDLIVIPSGGSYNYNDASDIQVTAAQLTAADPNFIPSNIIGTIFGLAGTAIRDPVTTFTAGINTIIASASGNSTSSTTAVKAREIQVKKSGIVRVNYTLYANVNTCTVYGQVYKNGVALGPLRTVAGIAITSFSEDITVNINDLIAIYFYVNYSNQTGSLTAFTISVAETPYATVTY